MKSRKTIAIVLSFAMMVWMFAAVGIGNAGTAKDQSQVNSDLSMSQDVKDYVGNVDMTYFKNVAQTLAYGEKYNGEDMQDNGLGWRSAGSDAEHVTAGYLYDQMKDMKLTNLEKSKITVDKFQFNSASFKIADTAIALGSTSSDRTNFTSIASYQCSGTKGDLNREIVDCGSGFKADYAGKNVKGKIVLVGVDQHNEAWIDEYIRQAKEKGAAALISYSAGGYGTVSDDSVNVQDICCPDLIPTVAISKNSAKKIQAAIKAGHKNATLNVNNDFKVKGGTSYNIIGKIKGTGNTGHQIMVASHYDKYWYGYQDDSTGIATVLSIAKAMKKSGYKPVNDIVFVCHGAEEWGASNSPFDWSNGSWHNITQKHPSWGGKTLAMFNFELTAFGNDKEEVSVSNVPEYRNFTKNFVNNSGLAVAAGKSSIVAKSIDTNTMEDGISYRWGGVPYFCNAFDGTDFMLSHYHTSFDNISTLNTDIANTNLNLYGAMAIYTDSEPALALDFTSTYDDLKAAYHSKTFKKAGIKTSKYKKQLANLKKTALKYDAKIANINSRYEEAVNEGADPDTIQEIRDEGTALNNQTLKAFKYLQKSMYAVDTWGIHIDSTGVYNNVKLLSKAVKNLSSKKLSAKKKINNTLWDSKHDGANAIYNLNGVVDYNYCIFSKKVAKAELQMADPNYNKTNTYWCTDRLVPVYYVGNTTYKLVNNKPTAKLAKSANKTYKKALKKSRKDLKAYVNKDMSKMSTLNSMLKLAQ